ncbi:FecR family protein [Sphingobacterium tabacisoli]|uniref:FecR family protein n=1 Tax=Sphingobacterium tabacisoli TaxID=2044855 RepID=A0ABW5L1A8_9SPHI|nr:FecR family protein [Sphingobacterium tabacisoli]
MHDLKQLKELYQQYLKKTIPDSGRETLMRFFCNCTDEEIEEVLGASDIAVEEDFVVPSHFEPRVQQLLGRINQQVDQESVKEKRSIKQIVLRWGSVAAVLALIGFATYTMYERNPAVEIKDGTQVYNQDIPAGGNRATMLLSDGTSVELSEDKEEIIAVNGNYHYEDGTPLMEEAGTVQSAVLRTPQGGQYRVVLSDGTKVWLNASSSLTYPTRFVGGKRQVTLVGEAYFEVAKDTKCPFEVINAGQVVEVLGTSFNIAAYPEEKTIKTTLLEGRVKIALPGNGMFKMLTPNQQSTTELGSSLIAVKTVDTESAVAWKNGYFMFDDEDFESIMKKVAKWYDVDIVYESKPQNIAFIGTVSRSKNISEVLHALERTGKVKFKISGRKITVI